MLPCIQEREAAPYIPIVIIVVASGRVQLKSQLSTLRLPLKQEEGAQDCLPDMVTYSECVTLFSVCFVKRSA